MNATDPDRGGPTLAILGYHHIGTPSPGAWETWYYIPEDVFAAQLTWLHDHGWKVIDGATLLAGLDRPECLPERAALLTVDDGSRLIVEYALPVLERFQCPAVLFMPTDYIGGYNAYDANTSQPREPLCSWDDLRELERRGVSVQSHSASHRAFADLDPSAMGEELAQSKAVLEAELGKAVQLFAYPYGDGGANPEAVGALLERCGYRAACLYDDILNRWPFPGRYRLGRLAMGPDTDLDAALGHRTGRPAGT